MFQKIVLVLAATLASSWGTVGLLSSNKSNQIYQTQTSKLSPSGSHYIKNDFPQNPSIPRNVFCIAHIGSKIYVGTDHGLYVSSNGGQTFAQNPSLPSEAGFESITQIGSKIYVGTVNYGLWISSNGGQTFVKNPSLPSDFWWITQIGSKIYVGIINNGLWVSSDGGQTFVQKLSGDDWWITQIGSKIYVGTGNDGLWMSSDGGKRLRRIHHFQVMLV